MNIYKKLNTLIPTSENKKLVLLIFFLFIGMIFEVLGIGALLPILSAILNPEILLDNELSSSFLNFFNIESKDQIIKIALITLLAIYFFKSIFLLFLSYYIFTNR